MQRGAFLRHVNEGPTGSVPPTSLPAPRPTRNADHTRLFVHTAGNEYRVVRFGVTLALLQSVIEPTFSRSDPVVLYTIGGETKHSILRHELDDDGRDAPVPQINLDHLSLPLALEQRIGNLAISDESLAVCFGGEGNSDHMFAGVLYEGEDQLAFLIDTRVEPGCGFLLRSVSIDLSGRYIVLEPATGPLVVWDTHEKTYTHVP
jgi:hypothetical protein